MDDPKQRGDRKAKHLSRRARIILVVCTIVGLLAGMYAIIGEAMDTLHGVRSFVGAEGLWSKHQKEGTLSLFQFAYTGEKKWELEYRTHLRRLEALERSRLELDRPDPDLALAGRGFTDIGVDPYDVPSIMRLYRRFKSFAKVDAAIKIWISADKKIAMQDGIAEELRRHIAAGASSRELTPIMERLHELSEELQLMEENFSARLGEAAHWADGLISLVLLLFTLCAAALVVVLGVAGVRLISSAEDFSRSLEQKNWLASSRVALGAELARLNEEQELADAVIRYLTPQIGGQVGALFIVEDDESPRQAASYGGSDPGEADRVIAPGDGVLGQVVKEREPIHLTGVPDEYLRIRSGLGEAAPRHILVYPVVHLDRVCAVIEVASLDELPQRGLELLNIVKKDIALNLLAARVRQENQALLAKTLESESRLQESNEELNAQQEELRQTNEELAVQAQQLEESQERLEVQHRELEESNCKLEEERERITAKNEEIEAAKKNLQRKARDLELASRYKSEFLANMSHELRTPLNSIIVLSGMLAANRGGGLSDKQVVYARTVSESGSVLMNLINEILDLSKIEAGHLELIWEEIKIMDVLDRLERQFRPVAEEKGIGLVVTVEEGIPEELNTDSQRLAQVIRNLLSNAIKFTIKGEVNLTCRRPAAGELERAGVKPGAGEHLVIAVRDTGIGIPQEQHPQVFEAFQQVDGSIERKFGGTGLGLTISRKLMIRLGGSILLESEPGRGSCFTIIIPVRCEQTSTSSTGPSLSSPPEAPPSPAPLSAPGAVEPLGAGADAQRGGDQDRAASQAPDSIGTIIPVTQVASGAANLTSLTIEKSLTGPAGAPDHRG